MIRRSWEKGGRHLPETPAFPAGSGLLAIVTVALLVTMVTGLAMAMRGRTGSRRDAVAMAAVLQWTIVLAAWGLLPLRLWA